MADAAERGKLKESRKRQTEEEEEEEEAMETKLTKRIGSVSDARMRAIAALPIIKLDMKDFPKYAIFAAAETALDSKSDWSDLEPGSRSAYRLLKHNLTDNEGLRHFYNETVSTFRDFYTKFSVQTAVKLLEVAFNLQTDDGLPLFANAEEYLIQASEEMDITDYSGSTLETGYNSVPFKLRKSARDTDAEYMKKVVTSLGFLACSLIRTVTRSADSFVRERDAVVKGFRRFYSYDIAVDGFPITEKLIAEFRDCVTMYETIKQTLYTFFYAGEKCRNGGDVKDFLYRTHTQFTGLHVYSLFTRGAEVYNVSLEEFKDKLHSPMFSKTLRRLSTFFQKCCGNTDQSHELKMWRFARIFDRKFYSELQTKKCAQFVAVLAFLLKLQDPDQVNRRHGDVLQITQIVNMPVSAKNFARLYANRAHFLLTGVQLSSD